MPTPTLTQAITIIKAGQRVEGHALLEQILEIEPRNVNALLWITEVAQTPEERHKYLNRILEIDPNNPYAIKGLELLSRTTEEQPSTAPTVSGLGVISDNQSKLGVVQDETKKCPYCAEIIKADAIICKHCGRDVSAKGMETSQNLAKLEADLVHWESVLQEQTQLAQQSNVTSRIIWILIGIILFPLGLGALGIIIIFLGLLEIIIKGSKRGSAERMQSQARAKIVYIRRTMIEIKSEAEPSQPRHI